jgi:ssDNA-binding Zn-finger/Zn-ribbon topoisomerase 1
MDKPKTTTCPTCGNEMVYKINSPAKVLECVHCPPTVGIAEEPTAIHRAAWDLSIAINNHEDPFQELMKFAEAINEGRT